MGRVIVGTEVDIVVGFVASPLREQAVEPLLAVVKFVKVSIPA